MLQIKGSPMVQLHAHQSSAAEDADIAFERFITLLETKRRSFEFVAATRRGTCILVGEGNLSFSLALARHPKSNAANLVATTYETERNCSPQATSNAEALRHLGARVLHGVDARALTEKSLPARAELIAFQFPNTGTRRSVYNRTDNHILVRRFLAAARTRLDTGGLIAITIVNSPHHLGAFDLPKAARWADCEVLEILPFYRSAWSGYGHVNTNNAEQSALRQYRSCSTWVFRPAKR